MRDVPRLPAVADPPATAPAAGAECDVLASLTLGPGADRSSAPTAPDAGPPLLVFRRNRAELAWFCCVLALGVVFAGTMVAVLHDRLDQARGAGQADPLVDGVWIVACLSILAAVGAIARELVRFLRRRVALGRTGVQVGTRTLRWEQIRQLREARQFRAGSWFYHLEIIGFSGERLWVTSGLVADYAGFRRELQRRCPHLPLLLAAD